MCYQLNEWSSISIRAMYVRLIGGNSVFIFNVLIYYIRWMQIYSRSRKLISFLKVKISYIRSIKFAGEPFSSIKVLVEMEIYSRREKERWHEHFKATSNDDIKSNN